MLLTPSFKLRPRAARTLISLCLSWALCHSSVGLAQGNSDPGSGAVAAAVRDGAHDFDFGSGTWHTHIKRTLDPFDDKSPSMELDGSVSSRKVWGGRAWLEEIQADGPKGHWQAMTLFLYNPQAHQWSMNFINSKMGTLNSPLIGEFKDGHGDLFQQDTFKDRAILVRGRWSNITADAHTYEESYSDDGGKTWKTAFMARKTRVPASEIRPVQETPNDFDFHVGTWKLHTARLLKPLSGATQWTEADGTVVFKKIWDGSANLSEIHTDYPTGAVDFLALRWYNPVARQWFLSFATAADGQLGTAMAGEFKDGRIDFYDQEPFHGKAILVRFSMWHGAKGQPMSEQAFSADGGKTWETNFRTEYTRVSSN